ncbi:hypothetical protein [Agreia sp. COWG]|uniref:hypothetical protein n=1 Tax=Agreia sp. COWG TaxID=2773266 RepID=UPI00192650CC|nr:hypothetical protein [Agreia sp. COWG]
MTVNVRFSSDVPELIGGPLASQEIPIDLFGYPTLDEIKRARERGCLGSLGVIELATTKWSSGVKLEPYESELALLLSDEADRVDVILGLNPSADEDSHLRVLPGWDEADRYWLDLFLRAIATSAQQAAVPEAVNFILDEFSYPDDLDHLSHRTDPTAASSLSGLPLSEELDSYLTARVHHYVSRQTSRMPSTESS